MDIKLKVKLSAYSKLPSPNYLPDAPKDDLIYARKNGEWVEIPQTPTPSSSDIILGENSGLDLTQVEDKKELTIRKWEGTSTEFESVAVEDDKTYYIADETPDLFIDGGTAFSDGNNEFVDISEYEKEIDGGNAYPSFDIELLPINAKGVYNG